MYAEFYKLSGMPFQLTPDTRFFFGSSGHTRAISHLIYGLLQKEGFVVITGEVGAGKTTLVERLWNDLDRSTYAIARVVTTQVSGDDLLRLVASAFGLTEVGFDKARLLRDIETAMRAHRDEGRQSLLIVDEVQSLSIPALEELRMLSNVTDNGRALLQTILLGQPQFRRTLASPELDQLRQRVLASYHLGPLTEAETRAYIEHRLRAVDWHDDPRWEDAAFAYVYRYTGGVPRRINRLCSRVLLYGALEEAHTISGTMVEATARELQQDLGGEWDGHSAAPAPPSPVYTGPAYGGNGAGYNGPGHNGPGYNGADWRHVPTGADLHQRVQALEETVARRERIFQRLMDVFGLHSEYRR